MADEHTDRAPHALTRLKWAALVAGVLGALGMALGIAAWISDGSYASLAAGVIGIVAQLLAAHTLFKIRGRTHAA